MLTTSMVRRRIDLVAVLIVLAATGSAAAYDFTLSDVKTEMELVQDFADGTLDTSALSERARQGLERPLGAPNSLEIIKGRLEEICPTVSVTNEYGHQYQFRSKHEGGLADWIVTTPSDVGTQIDGVLIFVVPSGSGQSVNGPPAILPPMLPGARKLPPGNLCLSPSKLSLLEQREKEACEQWPDLCTDPPK